MYLNIKSSRPQKSLVQVVPAVGGPEDYNALVLVEAVHLAEQLIDGLVGVRVQHAVRPLRPDRVDLVDEYDARSPLFGRLCDSEFCCSCLGNFFGVLWTHWTSPAPCERPGRPGFRRTPAQLRGKTARRLLRPLLGLATFYQYLRIRRFKIVAI